MRQDEKQLAKLILAAKSPMPARDCITLAKIPTKRADYILRKWIGKGWWKCGVSTVSGWLTDTGRETLSELTKEANTNGV